MQPYNELRFYTFTNFYISPIQHGIQTGHASVDLVRKYEFEFNDAANSDNDYMKSIRIQNAADNRQVVNDWADNHKTYVVLNGGDDTGITKALELVSKTGFPFVDFREPGLGNVRTAVGIVLPDYIFNAQRQFRRTEWAPEGFAVYRHEESDLTIGPDHELYPFMEFYKSCGLAR